MAAALVESVNSLRDLGLRDLDLPRVALIGMRNAKANVLHAILGFAADNSQHGCPFEYRMSRGRSHWSCRVSVCSISEDNVPLQSPLVRFIGDTITEKADLPAIMKRAQIAALDPSIPIANILSMSPDEMDNYLTTHLSLTYNTVCLELNGKGLTDLTLVEMPDLDLSFEHGTRRSVENLVLGQLQGKCIIVVAVPMNEDIFSKRALYLAKNVDPDGARTIGVLTNLVDQRIPDRPDFALQLGYYYTTYKDGANLGEQEKTIEKPIAKVLVSSSSHAQNNTERLEAKLSFLLLELIRQTIPLLRVDIIHCLDQCRQEIASLPPTVTESATYMLVMLTRLNDDIHRITCGSSEPSRLLEQIHQFYADFKLAIRKTAPNFVPILRSSSITQDIINHLADDEDFCERAGLTSWPFNLDDMRKHIAVYATRDLLSHFPHQAKKALIESFQNQWAPLVSRCLERVVGLMVKVIIERIQAICQGYELLTDHLRTLLGELIRHHLTACSEHLEAILEIELSPYTQQHHYLSSCSEIWLSRYRDIRKGRIGTSQRSNNSPWASEKTTSTPSPLTQNVQSEATGLATKLCEPMPFKPCPSEAQTTLPQGAENGDKNSLGQPPSTQIADARDKPSAGSESSKASTTSNSKAAEGASNTSPFGAFVDNTIPKNCVPVASSASRFSTTPEILPPLRFTFKEGRTQKDLPFPIKPILSESGKAFKAETPDEHVKDSDFKVPSSNATGISAQSPTTSSTASVGLSDTSYTSKDPDIDYRIALSALSRLGFTGLTRSDLEKLAMTDEYEDELKLMADVRGYFQIASMRVVDYVPAFITLKFVRALSSDILPFFMEKMGLGRPTANTICATYFAEDAETAVKREGLSNLQTRLESAQLELYKLGV